MKCVKCGEELIAGVQSCPACGTSRARLDPRFERVEEEYVQLLAAYNAGRLTNDGFKSAVDKLTVDDGTRFWQLGIENGLWYAHDGTEWREAQPPLAAKSQKTKRSHQTPTLAEPAAAGTKAPSRASVSRQHSSTTSGKRAIRIASIGYHESGKTTLLAAITSRQASQGLADPAESQRLRTLVAKQRLSAPTPQLEVAYGTERFSCTHLDCPGRDAPSIIRSTLTGIIVVVAADDGCMPQTEDHIRLAHGVRVPILCVFLNKCDLVDDEELVTLVELETRALLSKHHFSGDDMPFIRGSALLALSTQSVGSDIRELLHVVDDQVGRLA